ncbi:MAG: DNA primase [Candidatus Kapabacteria bacterium]|nr:DNA primase [Candidatus Kapabacteria bacterium]
MKRITDEIVEKVKAECDIVAVISPRVQLKKRGKTYIGLCPFHSEKSPSFNVNQAEQFFKCFGCGKGGDAIKFIQEIDGIPFLEAVEQLAYQFSIPIPEVEVSSVEIEKRHQSEALYNVLEASRIFGIKNLQSDFGFPVRQYLSRRGLTEQTINAFSVGLAPMEWSSFFKTLRQQGFSEQSIELSGVCARNDNGEFYDRFRGRLLFPIQNTLGKTIGFGGRLLEKQSTKAKYINSPQSPLYDKSVVLYGLYQARQSIRSKGNVLLCEGYMDVLSMHQHGFTNAVASCGTALTEEQVDVIAKYTKHIVIAYDGDNAGKNATMKAIDVILPKGLSVSVISLTNKEDPDSFLKHFGSEEFEKKVTSALGFVQFYHSLWTETGKLSAPQDFAFAIRELITKTLSIPDILSHHFFFKQIAELFSIDISLIEQEAVLVKESYKEQEDFRKRYTAPSTQTGNSTTDKPIEKLMVSSTEIVIETPVENVQELTLPNSEELNLLRIALVSKKGFETVFKTFRITNDHFESELCKSLYARIIDAQANSEDPLTLLFEDETLSDEEISLLRIVKVSLREPSSSWEKFDVTVLPEHFEKVIPDYLRTIQIRKVVKHLQELEKQIQLNDEQGTLDVALLEEFSKLDNQRRSLEEQRGK